MTNRTTREVPRAVVGRPEFVPSDYEYRLYWPDFGVRILLDRFYEAKGELNCEMVIDQVVEVGGNGPAARMHGPRKINLISDRTLNILGNQLVKRLNVDWDAMFGQMVALSIRQYRDGSPLVDLAEVDLSDESPRFLLPPFIDQHGVTVLVADGGTGKSMTALGMAIAVAAGERVFGEEPTVQQPVVYLDWEADEATHAERLLAICRGARIEPPKGAIYYQKMVSSLAEAVPGLRKRLMDIGAALVVVDSIGMARGGAPESAEETIKLFRALRSLDLPVLAIDHISKESKKNDPSSAADPIGSVYTRNSARLVWSMEGRQIEGRDETVIIFRNSKANFGRKERQRAYRYEFKAGPGDRLEAVTFTPVDWRETDEFEERVPVKDRIVKMLGQGALTRQGIADMCGISPDAARARLSEMQRAGIVIKLEDDRWGLGAVPREESPW